MLVTALLAIGQKLLVAVYGPKFLEWALFKAAKGIVDSTETIHDNEFYDKIKEAFDTPSK
jgi:hypothetical protein